MTEKKKEWAIALTLLGIIILGCILILIAPYLKNDELAIISSVIGIIVFIGIILYNGVHLKKGKRAIAIALIGIVVLCHNIIYNTTTFINEKLAIALIITTFIGIILYNGLYLKKEERAIAVAVVGIVILGSIVIYVNPYFRPKEGLNLVALYGDRSNLYINIRENQVIELDDPTITSAQFYANGNKVLVGRENSIDLYVVGRDNLHYETTLIATSTPIYLNQSVQKNEEQEELYTKIYLLPILTAWNNYKIIGVC